MAALAGLTDLPNSHPARRAAVVTDGLHRARAGRVRAFHGRSLLPSDTLPTPSTQNLSFDRVRQECQKDGATACWPEMLIRS